MNPCPCVCLGSGKAGVEELAGKICIGLLIWEVVDKVMGIDRDVNTIDTDGRTREVI